MTLFFRALAFCFCILSLFSCSERKSNIKTVTVDLGVNKSIDQMSYGDLKAQLKKVSSLFGERNGLSKLEWKNLLDHMLNPETASLLLNLVFADLDSNAALTHEAFCKNLELRAPTVLWFESTTLVSIKEMGLHVSHFFVNATPEIVDTVVHALLNFKTTTTNPGSLNISELLLPGVILAQQSSIMSGQISTYLNIASHSSQEAIRTYIGQKTRMSYVRFEGLLSPMDKYALAYTTILRLSQSVSGSNVGTSSQALVPDDSDLDYSYALLQLKESGRSEDFEKIKSSFENVFPVMGTALLTASSNNGKSLMKRLSRVDKSDQGNKNGELDPEELATTVASFRALDSIFTLYDANKDGSLQKTEARIAFDEISIDQDSALEAFYKKSFLGIGLKDKKSLTPLEFLKKSIQHANIFDPTDNDK